MDTLNLTLENVNSYKQRLDRGTDGRTKWTKRTKTTTASQKEKVVSVFPINTNLLYFLEKQTNLISNSNGNTFLNNY